MSYTLEKKVRLAVQKMSYNNGNKVYYATPFDCLERMRPENSENRDLAVHLIKDQKFTLVADAGYNRPIFNGYVNLYTGNIGEFYRLSTGGGIVNVDLRAFGFNREGYAVIPVYGQASSSLARKIEPRYNDGQTEFDYATMDGLQPYSFRAYSEPASVRDIRHRIITPSTPVSTTELTLYFKRVRDVYEQSKIIGNVVSINGETYSPQQFLNVFGDYLVPVRQPNDSGYLAVGKALRVYNDSDMPSYDNYINSIDAFSCCAIRKKTDEEAETISNRDLESYVMINELTGIQDIQDIEIENLWAAPRVFYKKDALSDGSIRNSQANYSFGQCINPSYQLAIRRYGFYNYVDRTTPDEMLCSVQDITPGEAFYFAKVKVDDRWEIPSEFPPSTYDRAIVQRFYDNNLSTYTEYQRYANNHLMYGDLYEEEHFNALQRQLEFRYNGDGLNSNYRTSIQVFNQYEIERYLQDLGYSYNYYHDWVTPLPQGLTFRKLRREDTILLTTATGSKIRR